VEERATSFEERNAARNIRAMLKDMGMPVATPAKFAALAATRTRNGRQAADGPHALVLTRNEIIHRRRERDRQRPIRPGRVGRDG